MTRFHWLPLIALLALPARADDLSEGRVAPSGFWAYYYSCSIEVREGGPLARRASGRAPTQTLATDLRLRAPEGDAETVQEASSRRYVARLRLRGDGQADLAVTSPRWGEATLTGATRVAFYGRSRTQKQPFKITVKRSDEGLRTEVKASCK